MTLELIKEQRREIVAATWTMWDATTLLVTKCVPPGLLNREDRGIDMKSMGADE